MSLMWMIIWPFGCWWGSHPHVEWWRDAAFVDRTVSLCLLLLAWSALWCRRERRIGVDGCRIGQGKGTTGVTHHWHSLSCGNQCKCSSFIFTVCHLHLSSIWELAALCLFRLLTFSPVPCNIAFPAYHLSVSFSLTQAVPGIFSFSIHFPSCCISKEAVHEINKDCSNSSREFRLCLIHRFSAWLCW